MKIYYTLGFYLDPSTGRGAGSLAKIANLSRLSEDFHAESNPKFLTRLYLINKVFGILRLFLADVAFLVKNKNDLSVVIVRDNVFFPISLARAFGIPVCSEVHAIPWQEVSTSVSKKIFMKAYKKKYLSLLRRSSMIIFNHPALQAFYTEQYRIRQPSIVTYNGGTFANELRSINRRAESSILFVYAGNVYPWHGVHLLLPVFDRLSESIDLKLLLVGSTDTEYSRKMKREFEKRQYCEVIDERDPDTLRRYIRCSDYCLLPTENTRTSPGNPIKLFDYLAEGKRIITQEKTFGYSDIVAELDAGVCVDFFDPERACRQLLACGITKSTQQNEQRIFYEACASHSWSERMKVWIEFFLNQGVSK